MGTTSLLISSTLSKKEKKLDHLEREFHKARLKLDEKRCLVERKQQLFTQMLEEEYAMAASFLQEQEVDVSVNGSPSIAVSKSMISKLEKLHK